MSTRHPHPRPQRPAWWRWGRWIGALALIVLVTALMTPTAAELEAPAPASLTGPADPAAVLAAPAPTLTVTRVVDGDTVDLSDGRRVRIIGIDTPETVKPNAPVDCWGPEASAFARTTLLDKRVTATPDPTQDAVDGFKRNLLYLDVIGQGDYSTLAAGAGVARSYIYRVSAPPQRIGAIQAAERAAQAAQRGMWGSCDTARATTTTRTTTTRPTATRPTPSPQAAPDDDDVVVVPRRRTTEPRSASGGGSGAFANCAAAKAAGAAPLTPGDPGWAAKLDRDNDGVACET